MSEFIAAILMSSGVGLIVDAFVNGALSTALSSLFEIKKVKNDDGTSDD